MIRVYMPTTLAVLREQVRDGSVCDLEQIWARGADEEAEYKALMVAAAVSQELLTGPGRRVVVVAELEDPKVNVPTPLRDVIAVYADTEDRPADADSDEDLAWFATQEIEELVAD